MRETFQLLFGACCSIEHAKVPTEVAPVLTGARLTALSKPDGGVRCIASGCSLRRGEGPCQAVRVIVPSRVCTMPVRFVDQGGHGWCGTHVESSHRRRPRFDHSVRGWQWCVNFLVRNAGEVAGDAWCASIFAFRRPLACSAVELRLV